jgi:hypothetical protein
MELTEPDICDLIQVLHFLKRRQKHGVWVLRVESDVWLAAKRLAEKIGGETWDRFQRTERQAS